MNPSNLARLRSGLVRLVLVLPLASGLVALADPPGLHETARYSFAGSGASGALALDADGHRLYVARGPVVDVVDPDTGRTEGSATLPAAVRGLALAPGMGRAFATLADGTVATLNTAGLSVVRTIAAPGRGPSAVVYDADTRRVFVADSASGDLAVIDPTTGAIVADLPLGGRLAGMACDGFARLFVNARDLNVIHVVDTHRLSSLGDFPTAPGVGPTGMALEDSGRRLFVPCLNGVLIVVDNDVGAVFRVLKLAGRGAACVAFGLADEDHPIGEPPWKGRIVTVTRDGTVNVGRMLAFVNYAAHDHFTLDARPLGVAIDAPRQRAYILLAASPTLSQLVVLDPYVCPPAP